jgi:hypothetical protein
MNFIYLTTFLYLLCRAYYMYMYICYYLLNSVFLKNKCYKIINQLVVETLKGNNITQEGIYILYNFVTDNLCMFVVLIDIFVIKLFSYDLKDHIFILQTPASTTPFRLYNG